jgi:hypothetical protein
LSINSLPCDLYNFGTQQTKKLVESDLPYVVLGVMYVYLLALSWTPETLSLMFASKYWLPEASHLCCFSALGHMLDG